MNATNQILAAVAAVAAATVNIAFAAPVNAAPVAVAYGDLDLTSAQGNDKLQARLYHAADEACGRGEGAITTSICRQKAIRTARQQMADATPANVVLASR